MEGLSANSKAAITLYAIYGFGFFIALMVVGIVGIGLMPLFPFQPDNLDWAQVWLIQTIFDYYGATICVSGVIISSEPQLSTGIGWTVAICLLGCPFACLWGVLQLFRRGSLGLASGPSTLTTSSADPGTWTPGRAFGAVWLATYAVGFPILLVVTFINHNLFDFDFGDLDWTFAWLITTVVDYYGVCSVLVAIMLSTEDSPANGGFWSCMALFLGTPGSCLWIVKQLRSRETLALVEVSESMGYTKGGR